MFEFELDYFMPDVIDGQDILYGFEGEIWKKIPAFPHYYVNEDGDVISIRRGYMHKLSTWTNQYGHKYVQLVNGKCSKKVLVHRLVAELYLDDDGPIVRHLDDDPNNNHYSNLAYGTPADNHRDMVEHGRMFTKPVYCFETERVYNSCAEAANDLGVDRSAITMNCRGINSSVSGYHLCYLEDYDALKNDKKRIHKIGNFKPVKAINVETGEELLFKSRMEASKYLNIPDCGISSVITGRITQTHGWTFREVDYAEVY